MIKKSFRAQSIILLLFAVVVLSGVASAQKNLQEGEERLISKKKMPDWVGNHSEEFVVGISGRFQNERDARRDALLDARKQIIDRLGVQLTTTQKERIVERSENASDNIVQTGVEKEIQTEAISRALIRVREKKHYVEKYATKHIGEIQYYYIAYVLVPFSRKEHDKLIETTIDQYETDFTNGVNSIALVQPENLRSVALRIQYLFDLCKNARAMIGMRPDFLARIDSWERKLKEKRVAAFENLQQKPIGFDQQPQPNGRLIEPIGIQLSLNGAPISGLPIAIKWNNKIIATGQTDTTGRFVYQCKTPIIGAVKIQLGAPLGENQTYSLTSCTFTNKPRIFIAIDEWDAQNEQPESIIQSAVAEACNKNNLATITSNKLNGFRIERLFHGDYDFFDTLGLNCAFVFVGKVTFPVIRESTLANGIFQAKANCTLKLIDVIDKQEIWGKSFDSSYQLGATPNEAGRRAKVRLSKQISESLTHLLADFSDSE
ncbi:MAG: hypothetical protein GXO74_00625 [Calditrichaeota bacterium]|nr:hypothetical protein [Calditrichota bacterium]